MSELINLRQARKQKARTDKQKTAATNRAKFGQTKAVRQASEKDRQNQKCHLDGHYVDKNPDP
ncbi:MAG: hypothetical protein COA47_09510 [Robiginitomaculum sp.]|nr:MAG: hypothetical protein COA47_09510 [Robiginitomaculum sp.]